MKPNKVVDNSSTVGYNEGNDLDEIIDLSGVPPINDVECKHETVVADPTDTIGDAVYYGCQNPKCGRGWYIRPNANKNIT